MAVAAAGPARSWWLERGGPGPRTRCHRADLARGPRQASPGRGHSHLVVVWRRGCWQRLLLGHLVPRPWVQSAINARGVDRHPAGKCPGGAEPLCRPSVRGEEPQVPHSSGCDQEDVLFPQGCLVLTGPSQGGLLVWFYQSTAVAVPQPGGLKPQLLVALQLEARGRDAGAVGRFLPRPLSLWCRRPPPPCVPTVVPLCPSVSPSLLMRTPVTWD